MKKWGQTLTEKQGYSPSKKTAGRHDFMRFAFNLGLIFSKEF